MRTELPDRDGWERQAAKAADASDAGARASDPQVAVAVLVDDEHVAQWQADALTALGAVPAVRVTHVVVNEQSTTTDHDAGWGTYVRTAFDQLRSDPLWSLLGVARLLAPDPAYERPVPLDSIEGLSSAERLSCAPVPVDEHWYELPDDTVDRLADADVVVRFGFELLQGRILDAPTHGVLSYHPGDVREYRGQPGGFWEFLDGEDEVGVTVQRLTETIDGGEIVTLERVDVSDCHTWQEIRARIYRRAAVMLVPAVSTVVDEDESASAPDRLGELYTTPSGWDVGRYLARNTLGRFQRVASGWRGHDRPLWPG